LLIRVRDQADQTAWERFAEVYTPFIYNVCKKRGLQDADASDVAQEVMQTVASAISRFEYDQKKGSFRSWLFSVTRARITDFHRKQQRQPAVSGGTVVQELLAAQPDAEENAWEHSWQQHLLEWASERVKSEFEPSTWKAFWATAVHGQGVEEVARELKLSSGAVYIARSRVLARLRRAVEEVDEQAVS
jgi:RNA polymerase sigma-70 factor (ECF subfamily)